MSILLGMAASLVVVLAGAVVYDWRHRHEVPHDINSAVRSTRAHVEGKSPPGGAGF